MQQSDCYRVYICNPVRNAAEEEPSATVPQDERGADGSGGLSELNACHAPFSLI